MSSIFGPVYRIKKCPSHLHFYTGRQTNRPTGRNGHGGQLGVRRLRRRIHRPRRRHHLRSLRAFRRRQREMVRFFRDTTVYRKKNKKGIVLFLAVLTVPRNCCCYCLNAQYTVRRTLRTAYHVIEHHAPYFVSDVNGRPSWFVRTAINAPPPYYLKHP